jgi:hypothetical protein
VANLRKDAQHYFDAKARELLRRETAALRAAVKKLRETRKAALAKATSSCQRSRRRASARARQLVAEAKAQGAQLREAASSACRRKKERAAKTSVRELREAQQEILDRRAYARLYGPNKRKSRTNKSEESDEVIQNLDPELVPLWKLVQDNIKPKKGASRTEAFLEWVESHPEESQAMMGDASASQAKADIERHEHELAAIEKALSKKRLTASDLLLLGIKAAEMQPLGLVASDPHDVLAFLELRARVREEPDTPF